MEIKKLSEQFKSEKETNNYILEIYINLNEDGSININGTACTLDNKNIPVMTSATTYIKESGHLSITTSGEKKLSEVRLLLIDFINEVIDELISK